MHVSGCNRLSLDVHFKKDIIFRNIKYEVQ